MKEKTAEFANRLSRNEGEYFCIPLEDYFLELKLPTLVKKQNSVLIFLVSEGVLNVNVGYNETQVSKNELLVIQPSKPFSIEEVSEDIRGSAFYISGDGIVGSMGDHSLIFNLDILETWSDSKYIFNNALFKFIENIFARISLEYSQLSKDLTIVNAYTITLLLELKSIYSLNSRNNSSAIDIVRRYKVEMSKTIDEKLQVSEYAQRLAITTNHLNKSVKLITGLSASQLLNKMKIVEAKYLLFMADLTVAQVANALGYDDQSYFTRFFKKHEGITPVEFRKKQP